MQAWRRMATMAVAAAVLLTGGAGGGAAAGPAWGWRGDGKGSFPEAQPPTRWGPDTNVAWKTSLPAPSNASPIIVGSRIFVCYDKSGLACIDKQSGKVLWQRTNEVEEVLSADALAALDKRRAEWRRLDGERNQLRKQMRELTQRVQLSTKAGRERHTQGLRKRWERSAAQARRQGRTVAPFKAPDYGPLPTPAEVADWRKQQRTLRTRQAELDRRLAALQDAAPVRVHKVAGYSTPTPVSDGRYVYALFASGVVVAYDLEGKRRWAAHLGPSTDGYGQAASPLLLGEVLLVHLNGLKALEKETGRLLWTLPARNRYGSPVRVRLAGGREAALTADGQLVDPAGKLIARGLGSLAYASPIAAGGTAYFVEGNARAYRIPEGNPAKTTERLWQTRIKNDRYYASAVLHDGILYAVTRGAVATALDAETGKVLWSETLPIGATPYPSVTAAGDYVFFSSDTGKTAVVEPGRSFRLLAVNSLELFRSSPVFEGKRMYVRGYKHLYCIGGE